VCGTKNCFNTTRSATIDMKWLLIAIVACASLYWVLRHFRASAAPKFASVDEKMQWLAGEAVDIVKQKGVL
jgi:hypothetical protein